MYNPPMWDLWLSSYPDLNLLDLDVGQGRMEFRESRNVNWLVERLLLYDERSLLECLRLLAEGDAAIAAAQVIREAGKGSLLPDIHLLAGAFHLHENRFSEARDQLYNTFGEDINPGGIVRRMFPSLRIQLRLSPCLLVPFYPNQFGAATMYALALWLNGQDGEALEVLGDMARRWGSLDEIRLLAGQIQLGRGDTAKAISALKVSEDVKRDALELARNLHLAEAYIAEGEYRNAARVLGPALDLVRDAVNPHLHARARLLLAECYERNGLLIDALRASAHVEPDEVPGFIAAGMLEREERWVVELGLLKTAEIERMAHRDLYQIYMPEAVAKERKLDRLETTRDPLKRLRPTEISWRRRRIEERRLAEYKSAVALGRDVELPDTAPLSQQGMELKIRIARAGNWWPSRKSSLQQASTRDSLARPADQAGFARFDFQGMREQSPERLAGERRAALLTTVGGAALLIAVCLGILRTCIY